LLSGPQKKMCKQILKSEGKRGELASLIESGRKTYPNLTPKRLLKLNFKTLMH